MAARRHCTPPKEKMATWCCGHRQKASDYSRRSGGSTEIESVYPLVSLPVLLGAEECNRSDDNNFCGQLLHLRSALGGGLQRRRYFHRSFFHMYCWLFFKGCCGSW
ncbi:hypothetical protein JTE90_021030 [Oedothorax gibbosus]|uniref:Uncharacterized protein n=1 Tax=Oedothorax gibbosus TaxID=931172 RepID=A0AAV6U687_9ARAC|nr:hypothetical protein JTE90_021030 [Oedothorax gibbosus]